MVKYYWETNYLCEDDVYTVTSIANILQTTGFKCALTCTGCFKVTSTTFRLLLVGTKQNLQLGKVEKILKTIYRSKTAYLITHVFDVFFYQKRQRNFKMRVNRRLRMIEDVYNLFLVLIQVKKIHSNRTNSRNQNGLEIVKHARKSPIRRQRGEVVEEKLKIG